MQKFRLWCSLLSSLFAIIHLSACRHMPKEAFASPSPNLVKESHLLIKNNLLRTSASKITAATFYEALQESEKELLIQLPIFGRELPVCSADLVKTFTKLQSVEVVQTNATNAAAGLSGSGLYIARSNGNPVAFIKTFPARHTGFAKEFWAQSNLLNKNIAVPNIIGMGVCVQNKQPYFLLASEFISGTVLSTMLESLMNQKIGSPSRKHALETCSNAYNHLGQMLGTLHTKHTTMPTQKAPHTMDLVHELHQQKIDGVFDSKEDGLLKNKLPENELKSLMHTLKKALPRNELTPSYTHRDAHPGNYIFDEKSEKIYMIDLEDSALSIGAHEEPLGNAFDDYAKAIDSLRVRMTFGLTCDEFTALKQAFDKGYLSAGAQLPSLATSDYFSFMEIMEYFNWYLTKKSTLPQHVKSTMESMFKTGVSWLHNAINSGSINKNPCRPGA